MNNHFLSVQSFTSPQYLAISAWFEHIPFAFELIKKLRPKVVAELGVHYGTSYFAFCQAIRENGLDCTCYGIDTWAGDEHAGFYEEEVFGSVHRYNRENYSAFSTLLRSYFDEAVKGFADHSIDLLHIDGLHSYEAVKKDFETWKPKLSARSVVLFHDTCMMDRGFGVYQLWDELSATYPSFSFLHGLGLGVLFTGGEVPVDLLPLFQASEEDAGEIRKCYERLGSSISEKFRIVDLQRQNEEINGQLKSCVSELTAARVDSERLIAIQEQRQLEWDTKEAAQSDLQVKMQEEINLRMQEIVALEGQLTKEQERAGALEQEISHQQIIIAEKQKNIELSIVENERLQAEIAYYRNSLSWRLTRPLRQLNQRLHPAVKTPKNK